MASDDERREDARAFQRIDDAFRRGDLAALRAAVDDPAAVPNGRMPPQSAPASCTRSITARLAFIRTLLEIGADPNAPADDGFPPLIAALSKHAQVPGSTGATDVDDLIRLLLSFGADPESARHQRLHAAPHGRRRGQPAGGASSARRRAPIPSNAHGSTSVKRRSRWHTPPECGHRGDTGPQGQPLHQRLRSGLTCSPTSPAAGSRSAVSTAIASVFACG